MSREDICNNCGKVSNPDDSYDGKCFLCTYRDEMINIIEPKYVEYEMDDPSIPWIFLIGLLLGAGALILIFLVLTYIASAWILGII